METETTSPAKSRSAFRIVYDFLSGFHVATVTLLLLLVLTWLATLEQIDAGLYPTLNKYFSWKSPWLVPELNGKKVPIILPGGYYVSALLLLNMTLGGIIRIRKGWRQAGNLISHFGIVFMLLGGAVAHHFSERGNMAIYEGETSDVAEDFHEYVVELAESKDGGTEKIHVIRGRFLTPLEAGNPREFRFGDLPLALEISGYLGNCQPESKLINAPAMGELVMDGYYLRELDSHVETERNIAGCYARIVKADGSKSDPFILWGGQFHPFTATVDGRNFTIDMRKRLWPMPFDVKLDKFTADFHPGTSRPAKFISDVRRVENGREAEIRIQMNEPMRYEGFTFFQASYGPTGAKPGEEMYSVFEIVRNPADHWPEYSLYVVAFGMLVTFLTKLGGHLGAASRKRKMQHKNQVWGKWVVAALALGALGVVFVNMLIDNMPKGAPQKVEAYEPWEKETLEVVESLPLQDGGRIKPFSTYAGFKMLQLHGARSMKVEGKGGEEIKLKPTEWLMDTLFRPGIAVDLPTFRVDNSDVLKAIGVETKGRRDRYSYTEIQPGIQKLIELAQSYEPIEKKKRDPMQQQAIDLAYNVRNYESLLGYFSFARRGVELRGSGGGTEADKRADLSAVMTAAPQLMGEVQAANREKREVEARLQDLLQQVLEAANYSKYGMFILPPKNTADAQWLSAGNTIMEVMTMESKEPEAGITDIKALETAVRSVPVSEKEFRKHFAEFKGSVEKRADSRGELKRIGMEVSYFKRDYFLDAMVWFLLGTLCALGMWGIGSGKVAKVLSWGTLGFTLVGLAYCVIAIVKRCIIMQRPPVGNLYDTIIFIAATGVFFALLIELTSRRRFSLGLAPILGLGLIILARRYEVGDAGDHLDPLVAVLDSNFWLATHVITITLGYSAGLLAAMLSCGYVLIRGLNLDGNNKDLRRSLTKAVYGSICLTVFLSLVGTVLGGIWANYSWGRFWGWDPKENGALMIVLWTLAILHARLGGLINDWGLHLASLFTACIVAFSWWHVNFLGVGLHNYGFTAGKGTIWVFYGMMMLFILFGAVAMVVEYYDKQAKRVAKAKPVEGLEA